MRPGILTGEARDEQVATCPNRPQSIDPINLTSAGAEYAETRKAYAGNPNPNPEPDNRNPNPEPHTREPKSKSETRNRNPDPTPETHN